MAPPPPTTMVWTHAKTIAVLAAAHAGAQGLLPSTSGQLGTIIISSSTQYFTVTTGSPGSSSPTGPVSGGVRGGGDSSIAAAAASATGASLTQSQIPSPDAFVIEIGAASLAIESGAPLPQRVRRQDVDFTGDGEFVGVGGGSNAVDCSLAARFVLVDGELTSGGQKVWADPAAGPERLAARPPPPAMGGGAVPGTVLVTRTWEVVGGELVWANASFAGGRARFCVDAAVHGVWFITTGAGDDSNGCAPVELTPLLGKPGPPPRLLFFFWLLCVLSGTGSGPPCRGIYDADARLTMTRTHALRSGRMCSSQPRR